MKWLVRFSLSLTLVFLSVYSHLHAHEAKISYSLQKVFEKTAYGQAKSIEHLAFAYKSVKGNTEKVSEQLPATDKEEEDDTLSSRKYLEISNCFTGFFYDLNAGFFWRQAYEPAGFRRCWSTNIVPTYLLFCVIRI